MPADRRALLLIVALALALRLIYALGQDHAAPYADTGGDARWYLANGYALAAGLDETTLTGYGPDAYPISLRNLPTPPLYLLFVGIPQALLQPEAAMIAIRIMQALLGALTVWWAGRLAGTLAGSRAGLIAAAALALHPAFVIEPAAVATETLYLALIAAGLWCFVRALDGDPRPARWIVAVALLLGLATLTRAVALMLPVGLALLIGFAWGMRRGTGAAAALLLIYALTVGTWTAYSLARWDRFVIAGEGFAAFLFIGATEDGWTGGAEVDAALGDELPPETGDQQAVYLEGAGSLIGADLPGYLARRAADLAGAALQPHGTLSFPGDSLRALALDWLRNDRTLGGLVALAGGDSFWPKLALYIFHYAGLMLGVVGFAWALRARPLIALALAGFIAYTLLIHFALLALPRYLFPTQLPLWIFAAAALARIQPANSRR